MMWLGYFLTLNFFGDAIQDFHMFSIYGFSIGVIKIVCIILIIVTPYFYVNHIIRDREEDGREENGKQDYSSLIYFILFILVSYFVFYGLNGFHYVLDYHD